MWWCSGERGLLALPEVPGSILGGDVQFHFSLVKKKFDDCEKICKCR